MDTIKQSFEYFMWSPHEKAKLFRRFTGELPMELKNKEIITVEDNRYVYRSAFRWVETTSAEIGDNQPLDGLIVEQNYLTIRTNSLMRFEKGDLVMLPNNTRLKGLWIISDGVKIDYIFTPKEIQTYQYLPLTNAG